MSQADSCLCQVPSIGHDNRALAGVDDEGIDGPAAPKNGAGAAGAGVEGPDGQKLYVGAANYHKLVVKRDVMDRKSSSIGPIKAPTNVRITQVRRRVKLDDEGLNPEP